MQTETRNFKAGAAHIFGRITDGSDESRFSRVASKLLGMRVTLVDVLAWLGDHRGAGGKSEDPGKADTVLPITIVDGGATNNGAKSLKSAAVDEQMLQNWTSSALAWMPRWDKPFLIFEQDGTCS